MRAELRGHDGAAATSRRWFRFENRNPKTRKSPGDACMCVICWHRPLALTRATANKHMKKKHKNEWVVQVEEKKQALMDYEFECDLCQ